MRCVNALATEAILVDQAQNTDTERPYGQRRQTDDLEAEAASGVRERFWSAGEFTEDAYQRLDISRWFGAKANAHILVILSQEPAEPEAVAAFARTAQTLVEWWNSDNDRNHGRRHRERNHKTESAISVLLQSFVMRTSADAARTVLQPLLDAVDSHPREIHWIIRGLTDLEDREPNTPRFWFVWELFADCVRRARWLDRMDDGDRQYGDEMISAVFFDSSWRDLRHWKSLEGHAHRVHALFEDLPSSVVLDAYVRFLYYIGERSLPEAFVRIATRLRSGEAQGMLRKTNTVFMRHWPSAEFVLQGVFRRLERGLPTASNTIGRLVCRSHRY